MAKGSTIARRWSQALFEAASDEFVRVGRDLQAVVDSLWGDDQARAYLESDRVALGTKKEFVRTLAKAKVHRLVLNCLLLAIDKRREGFMPGIAAAYGTLSDKAQGLTEVEVRTAVELPEANRQNLGRTLAGKLGESRLKTKFLVDPSLLGGLQVRVDDRLFDASLRRRLERLGEQLAKARVGV